jgi:hypothetical protein
MEVQRLSCVAPAGLEHRALKDANFHGFFLPKGIQTVQQDIYLERVFISFCLLARKFRNFKFISTSEIVFVFFKMSLKYI